MINIAITMAMNNTLPNISFMILFCMFILSSLITPKSYECFDILNKFYLLLSFVFLNFHFVKNIPGLQHEKFDIILGVALFKANNLNFIYFCFLIFGYVISLSILKYDYIVSNLKTEAKQTADEHHLNYNELIEVSFSLVIYDTLSLG